MRLRNSVEDELTYKVETWSAGGTPEIEALARSVLVGRAAFAEVVQATPGRRVSLRQGARIVEEHSPQPFPREAPKAES